MALLHQLDRDHGPGSRAGHGQGQGTSAAQRERRVSPYHGLRYVAEALRSSAALSECYKEVRTCVL